jgi:tetratricopeptide (TPR) repeat protein
MNDITDPVARDPGNPSVPEPGQRLSRSVLWEYQRQFFDHWGVAAWSHSVVPSYITNNPFIAATYARVVLGWLRDCQAAGSNSSPPPGCFGPLDPSQPVYLVELGAGCGCFAFLFLKRFLAMWEASALRDVPVRYVMTDFAERNLAYWRGHPSLRPFVEAGVLDFARFDPARDQELRLEVSGTLLAPGTVKNPVAVLANYVFDSLPQDAFAVIGGRLHESLATLTYPTPEPDPADPKWFAHGRLAFEHRPITGDYYADPAWNRVLTRYEERLDDTVVLFPEATLRCLDHLRRLADGRLLVLCGDKGQLREEALRGQPELSVAVHGSLSLMVNFDALEQVIAPQGGQVLRPADGPAFLAVVALLFGQPPGDYGETRLAFDDAISRQGPDDFFILKKAFEKAHANYSLEQLLAFLRWSGWDANVLLVCFPVLLDLLGTASERGKLEAYRAIRQVWDHYYPIGEEQDLALHLGRLLMALGYYGEAVDYFQHSLERYAPEAETYCHLAVCHYVLRQMDAAAEYTRQALDLEPTLAPARALRLQIEEVVRCWPPPKSAAAPAPAVLPRCLPIDREERNADGPAWPNRATG